MTAQLTSGMEYTGSLTGHILSQGRKDAPTPKSRTAKVVLVMLLVMGVLVVVGIAAAAFAGDTVRQLFDNLIHS